MDKIATSLQEIHEHVEQHPLALLYFSQASCSVCHGVWPKMLELLIPYPEIAVIRVDVGEVAELRGAYSVFTVPCIVLMIDGVEAFRMARFFNGLEFAKTIGRLMAIYLDR